MTSALTAILNSVVVGLLRREVTVELFNISCSGCLLESASAIPMGTLGTLCVEIDGTVYIDDVRVSRSLVVPGGGERRHVGAEFLSLQRLGQRSLRLYAASLGGNGMNRRVRCPWDLWKPVEDCRDRGSPAAGGAGMRKVALYAARPAVVAGLHQILVRSAYAHYSPLARGSSQPGRRLSCHRHP